MKLFITILACLLAVALAQHQGGQQNLHNINRPVVRNLGHGRHALITPGSAEIGIDHMGNLRTFRSRPSIEVFRTGGFVQGRQNNFLSGILGGLF